MFDPFDTWLEEILRRVENACDAVDPDLIDVERGPDTLMLSFKNGVRLVISPQRPVQQIWVATKDRGYHFCRSETGEWMEERGRTGELFALLRAQIREHAHIDLAL